MAQLSQKRLFLLDMDGTIYLSDRLFDRVPEFLARVRGSGGRAVFLTNNSSRGVEDYIEKLRAMGIETAREDYVTSVDAAIRHLRLHHPGRRCYVFGTRSFAHQLEQAGVPLAAGRDGAEVLLCGFDTELTFQKLEDACILLGRGVPFVATNPDWVCPTWYGSVPDCGSVCGLSDRASVRCGDAMSYLRSGEKFDLIFLDPPYAAGLLGPALEEIARFDICREHGIIVAESALETALPALAPPYTLYREYRYGKIKLTVYHRGGNEETI